MSDNFSTINIPNAKFIYRTNFKGTAGEYNNEGERFFNVILEGDALKQAEEYGVHIKWTKPKTDEYEPVPYIKVRVGYKFRPPHAELINSHCKRYLTEQTIGLLDDYEFECVDLVLRPRRWHSKMGTGVNTYLQAIYATVKEDPFVAKYYQIPDADGEDSVDAGEIF